MYLSDHTKNLISAEEKVAELIKERDQLRAEVERLKRDYEYDHKCLHEVRDRCELWKQRAERAEAEVAALKQSAESGQCVLREGAERNASRAQLRDWHFYGGAA